MPHANGTTSGIWRLPEVLAFVPDLTERTLKNWEKAGRFPKRFKIGPRAVGWNEREIRAWAQSRTISAPAEPTAPLATPPSWSADVVFAIQACDAHSDAMEKLHSAVVQAQSSLARAQADIDRYEAHRRTVQELKRQRSEQSAAVYSGQSDKAQLDSLDRQIAEQEAAGEPLKDEASKAQAALPLLQGRLEETIRAEQALAAQRAAMLYGFGKAVVLQLAEEVVCDFVRAYDTYCQFWAALRAVTKYAGDGRPELMPMPAPSGVTLGMMMNHEDPRLPRGCFWLNETIERREEATKRLAKRLEGLIPETTTHPAPSHVNGAAHG